jgi:hypothetical protein
MAYDLSDILLVTSDTGVSGSESKLTEAYDWNVAKGFNVVRYSGALPTFENLILIVEEQNVDPGDVVILANPYIKFDETSVLAENGLGSSDMWALSTWSGKGPQPKPTGPQLNPRRDPLYGSWWFKAPFNVGLISGISGLVCGPRSDGGLFNKAAVDVGYTVTSPALTVRTLLTFDAAYFPWLEPQYQKSGEQYNPLSFYLPMT